jgi:hypothetical protein
MDSITKIIDLCHNCGQNHANNRCARCTRIRYCDIRCANEDYVNHKIECQLWRLSSKDIDNNVINDNYIIKIIIENIRDWYFHLLMGSTNKSWRAYIKSMYIVDENHKLYYTDDNLIGVIYSLKRRNPTCMGDYYSNPIYESMGKSGKPSYSVLKYINYANKWHLKLWILAYDLCTYGSDELYNCLDKCLKPCENYHKYVTIGTYMKIIIGDYLTISEEKYKKQNIIAIKQVTYEKYGQNSNNYSELLMSKIERLLKKHCGNIITSDNNKK